MGTAIENVENNATGIMNAVNSAQPPGATAQFAAADYKDGRPVFPCELDPYAFNVGQGLTESLPAVQGAIEAWEAGGGCDAEESQINALYQLASGAVSFRPGSTRVIVWFGDVPGHDPDFGLTLNDAIEALVAANIRVIAVPVVTTEAGLDATGQASAVAKATGGEVMPSATPGEVSAKILEGLENLPVTVTPEPKCDSGLSATYDAPSKTVTSGSDVSFEETLTVAPNAPDGGVLHCEVDFLLNGSSTTGLALK